MRKLLALIFLMVASISIAAEGPQFFMEVTQEHSDGPSQGDYSHTITEWVYYDSGPTLSQMHLLEDEPRSLLSLAPDEQMSFVMNSFVGDGRGWSGDEKISVSYKYANQREINQKIGMKMMVFTRKKSGASLFIYPWDVKDDGLGLIGFCSNEWNTLTVEFTEKELETFSAVSKSVTLTTIPDYECVGKATVRIVAKLDAPKKDKVNVEGSGCLCSKDSVADFTASTELTGGSFQKFEITYNGKKPTIVQNQGGNSPLLKVKGSGKEHGSIDVVAVYKKGSELTKSKPKRVNFCEVAKPKTRPTSSGANGKDYVFKNGVLNIEVNGEAWFNGNDSSENLKWLVTPNNENVYQFESTVGKKTKIISNKLPRSNKEFGKKEIVARLEQDLCSCSSEPTDVRIFFELMDKNNPEGRLYPNWVYYWKQTSAGQEIPFLYFEQMPVGDGYTPSQDPTRVLATYEFERDEIIITDAVITKGCPVRPNRDTAEGIDCFAEVLRHENQHRIEFIDWWGYKFTSYAKVLDNDFDLVPNDWEEAHGDGCSPYFAFSCNSRPKHLGDIPDVEWNAYNVGWTWGINSANNEDWSAPGKQWPEGN